MEYVFGNILTLKLLTELLIRMYKQNPLLLKEMFINYNLSGTLEDGSKPSSAGILVDIQI